MTASWVVLTLWSLLRSKFVIGQYYPRGHGWLRMKAPAACGMTTQPPGEISQSNWVLKCLSTVGKWWQCLPKQARRAGRITLEEFPLQQSLGWAEPMGREVPRRECGRGVTGMAIAKCGQVEVHAWRWTWTTAQDQGSHYKNATSRSHCSAARKCQHPASTTQ